MRAHTLLIEAARRYIQFGEGKDLRKEWTGLGTATAYSPAVKQGLMEVATALNPQYATWWKLTSEGADQVQEWLDRGLSLKHFDCFELNSEGRELIKAAG